MVDCPEDPDNGLGGPWPKFDDVIFIALLGKLFSRVGQNERDLGLPNAPGQFLVKLSSLSLGIDHADVVDHLALLTLFGLLSLHRCHELGDHLSVLFDFHLLHVGCLDRLALCGFVLLPQVLGLIILVAALLQVDIHLASHCPDRCCLPDSGTSPYNKSQ